MFVFVAYMIDVKRMENCCINVIFSRISKSHWCLNLTFRELEFVLKLSLSGTTKFHMIDTDKG
jgi:hypothetical protein